MVFEAGERKRERERERERTIKQFIKFLGTQS